MDCGLAGSSVYGILQAGTLESVAMPSSRKSSQPGNQTQISCLAGGFFIIWATRGSPSSLVAISFSLFVGLFLKLWKFCKKIKNTFIYTSISHGRNKWRIPCKRAVRTEWTSQAHELTLWAQHLARELKSDEARCAFWVRTSQSLPFLRFCHGVFRFPNEVLMRWV